MKTLNLLAAILLVTTFAFATTEKVPTPPAATTTITGNVVDKLTGEALAGVKITIGENNEAVYTDLDGNFQISNVKQGKHEINTNFISYKVSSTQINCNTTTSNVELELDNK